MLWRRERRRIGSGEKYIEGTSANSVLVQEIGDLTSVRTVLYADSNDSGKIGNPTPADLATRAIQSVRKAEDGKDGITYLMDAIACGIETPLATVYRAETLKRPRLRPLKRRSERPRGDNLRRRNRGSAGLRRGTDRHDCGRYWADWLFQYAHSQI